MSRSPDASRAQVTASGFTQERRFEVQDLLAKFTTAALVLVLLGLAGFSLWSAESTASSAQRAVRASRLADDNALASKAVAAEESLERKYRLEPGPDVRQRYDQAAAELAAALIRVERNGDAHDRQKVERVLAIHGRYLDSINRMFAAVDSGDTAEILRIDQFEVDPKFAAIEGLVDGQTQLHHGQALQALADLNSLETRTSRATPVVFIAGLVLVALFSSVLLRVQRQRRKAEHDSQHDPLTGLANRALLDARFKQALVDGQRHGSFTGLLLLDLDRFKEVNDTLGHHYGDQLLTQVGPRLASAVRDVHTIARLGGDEFAVLLPNVDGLDAALDVANSLLDAIDAPFKVDGIELDVEASIGVVISGMHGEDSSTLMQRADVAMYVAKRRSLGAFVYDPHADEHSPERLALLGDLRRALDRGELVLHYQPKIALLASDVCGVEALVRWEHPELGLLPPDRFIPLAEQTGLIEHVTSYVLNAALSQVRDWADAGHLIPVAVNVSARNLLDERLVQKVSGLLDRHRIPAHMLEIEVTESAIMLDPPRAQRILTGLHELGIRIAIDDFGAGYTSLAQLKNLPVTELKVDRSFVIGAAIDDSNALIIQSVIDLGHNLGLTVVAEGVETAEVLDNLSRYGCDVAQGFHFSRPLLPAALLAWYTERLPCPSDQGSSRV